jgi:hypothetical protein
MEWHDKTDLGALFGEQGREEFMSCRQQHSRFQMQPPPATLMAPAHPVANPPGPTPLAPRPGPMGAGPMLPPKPMPKKKILDK